MNTRLTYSFPKVLRLRTRQEYQRMSRGTRRYMGQWILVELRQSTHPYPKLGITVTRRYGKAHQRNRFKRLIREAFRLSYNLFPQGLEILVKPRSKANQAHRIIIQEELQKFVAEFQCFTKKNESVNSP